MALIQRDEILARLRAKVADGKPIIGGGTGISAKMSGAGGTDLLLIQASVSQPVFLLPSARCLYLCW